MLAEHQRRLFTTVGAWAASAGTGHDLAGDAAIIERREGDFLARLSGQRSSPVLELELSLCGETIALFNFDRSTGQLEVLEWNDVLADGRFAFPEITRH